jgi:hypothetical protein
MRTPRYARQMTTAAGVLAVLMCARPVLAVDVLDDPVQIDERAAQLVQASNSLSWELYRYHQQQPDYNEAYRAAKEIWTRAGELRDALRAGPVETRALEQHITQMNETLDQLADRLAQWGDGDRSLAPAAGGEQRTVVSTGRGVDLPLLGHVGRQRYVVTEDGPSPLARIKLHPNSTGSRRSLERQFRMVRIALDYLEEDAGMTGDGAATEGSGATGRDRPSADQNTSLGEPQKIVPRSQKKPAPARK